MRSFCAIVLLFATLQSGAQKVDSIFFNLYTDSLKRGVHNYINVVGRLPDGSYRPMNSKQVNFQSNAGTWEGNDLILEPGFKDPYVFVKVSLKENPSKTDSAKIYLKTIIDTSGLKTMDEILPKKKN